MTIPFRSELETAAARAWGASNPVAKAERDLARAESAIRAALVAATSLPRASFIQGLLESTEDIFAVPGTGPREVDVRDLQAVFDDAGVPIPAATAVIPRPMDGVTRELIAVAEDAGGGLIVATVVETHGTLAASPTIERQRAGVFTALTLGVDYSQNLGAGTVTLIAGATNLDPGDFIHLTGAWSGEWTVAVVALEDGTLECRRGYSSFPDLGYFEKRGAEFGEIQLFEVHGVTDATTVITAGMIDFRPAHYLAPAAILRLFSGSRPHTHDPRIPHDGGSIYGSIRDFCWELDGSNNAILKPVPFAFRPDGCWQNDPDQNIATSGLNIEDSLWEFDGAGDLMLKEI